MVFERVFNRRRTALCCAVITPVGPGHGELYRECRASVLGAWRSGRGAFSDLKLIAVDDLAGTLGRSRARNQGVGQANDAGAEWIFFLDADDVMLPNAFAAVADLVARYDAIWGLIASQPLAAHAHHLRLPQILTIDRIEQVLIFDPFLTLQMGHFVRTEAALATPFDERLDAGEDFDYYLRLWRRFRCLKMSCILFAARQGRRSAGARAATAECWGATVRERLAREREEHGLGPDADQTVAIKNAAVAELQAFYRDRALADRENFEGLAREMPFRGWQTIVEYAGKPFTMLCDNDDHACLSLAWLGEYEYVSTRIWQELARRARIVVDAAAGTGFYALLASRAVPRDAAVYCCASSMAHRVRLRLNIEANEIVNVKNVPIESAAGEQAAGRDLVQTHAHVADLVRAQVGAIAGAMDDLFQRGPDLLIVPGDGTHVHAIGAQLQHAGYHLYELNEEGYRVRRIGRLSGREERNCWATRRPNAEVDTILREAGVAIDDAAMRPLG